MINEYVKNYCNKKIQYMVTTMRDDEEEPSRANHDNIISELNVWARGICPALMPYVW